MRSSILTIIFALSFTSIFAQRGDNFIKLSDKITTENRNITGFDKIEVSEDFEVYIRFSDTTEKVEIEANENLHPLIKVEQKGNRVKISTKSYSTKSGGFRGGAHERLVAYITAKRLTEISADEDVVIELEDKLSAEKLSINLEEDCTLTGHIEVENLIVNLDEDSVLEIEGSAQNMDVQADEDSVIGGFDFEVGDLVIELNEDSVAKLTVNGNIELDANEDSYFYYRGNGTFTHKRLRGDSEVKTW